MTGEKLKGLEVDVRGESDFDYDSFEDHMKKMGEQSAEQSADNAEKNPYKEKYLAELKECEEKLDNLQEKYADSLDEADMYFNVITRLLNDNRATDEVIMEEVDKLKKALQTVEQNSAKLLDANEAFGGIIENDNNFLTAEEEADKKKKYYNN